MPEYLSIDKITPADDNVRTTTITEASVKGLAQSIVAFGVLQPLVVKGDGTLVFGHRRHRAIQLAQANGDLPKSYQIPVIFAEDTSEQDVQVQRLIENLQRIDLTPLEEAHGYYRLTEAGMTRKDMAQQIGVSAKHLANRLSLLSLDGAIQVLLNDGSITMDKALLLTKLEPKEQVKLATKDAFAIENHLATKAAKAKAAKVELDLTNLGVLVIKAQTHYSHTVTHEDVVYVRMDQHPDVSSDEWDGSAPKDAVAAAVSVTYNNAIRIAWFEEATVSQTEDGERKPTAKERKEQKEREQAKAEYDAKREADLKVLYAAAVKWTPKEFADLLLDMEVRSFYCFDNAVAGAIAKELGIEIPEGDEADPVSPARFVTEVVDLPEAPLTAKRRAVIINSVLGQGTSDYSDLGTLIREKAGIGDDHLVDDDET